MESHTDDEKNERRRNKDTAGAWKGRKSPVFQRLLQLQMNP